MPGAPPNSALVSVIAEAAPARSGGAAPTARSVARVSTGAKASEDDRPGHQQRGRHGPEDDPAEDGSDHSPASRGDSPRTSCRYWAVNNSAPKPTKKLSRLVVETRA
jgi:hypothetical protein